jgi:DNA-binding transcriptional MerR regulator
VSNTITRPLSTTEVSEQTGVPVGTLRYWRHAGIGPRSYTLGGRSVRYDPTDVQHWLDEQKAATSRGGAA